MLFRSDNVIYIGTNGKMTEVCAAMGLTNLEGIDVLVTASRRNYTAYKKELARIPGLHLREYDSRERSNYQYIVLELDHSQAGVTRDELIQILHAENILARRYFWPGCHKLEPYRSYYPHAGLLLPETERVAARVIILPTGACVRGVDIRCLCSIIRFVEQHASEVRHQLDALRQSKKGR